MLKSLQWKTMELDLKQSYLMSKKMNLYAYEKTIVVVISKSLSMMLKKKDAKVMVEISC